VPIDRGLLRWTAFLVAVDVAVWVAAWLWYAHVPIVGVLGAWCAASLAVVCVLYARTALGHNGGPVLRGEVHRWLWPLLLPYLMVSLGLYVLARLGRREEVVCEVVPGVYLGPRLFDRERAKLEATGVYVVVDLTSELPVSRVYGRAPFTRVALPLLDRSVPDAQQLDALVDALAARVRKGERLFVHCAFGRGRSALVACALVIALGHANTADGSLERVKAARPAVRLRSDAREALRGFAARYEALATGGGRHPPATPPPPESATKTS
jgi:hypothetical protein